MPSWLSGRALHWYDKSGFIDYHKLGIYSNNAEIASSILAEGFF